MEGRTPVKLIAPGIASQDEFGEVTTAPVEHPRSALRTDRGGRRGVVADIETGTWEREYEVRSIGLAVNDDWLLQDVGDGGRIFAIESAIKPVGRQRKMILRVRSRS